MPVPAYAQNYVNAQMGNAQKIDPRKAAMAQKFGPSQGAPGMPVGTPVGPAPTPSAAFIQRFGQPGQIAKGAPRVMGAMMKKGGKVSSASSRGDGIAQKGKTKGTMIMCGGGMAKGKK